MKKYIVASLLCAVIGFESMAISLTSHRIYLTQREPTTSFTVFNRSTDLEECQVKFRHFSFDKASVMGKEIKDTLPENNASSRVRFSPKRFTVKPGSNQSIRLSLRRKPNQEPAEYHSYLSVNCGKVDVQGEQLISVSPRLVHNVPLIARTAELHAKLSISDMTVNQSNNKFSFRINREGNRSVYGVIEIIDKSSGKTINSLKNVSIYIQSDYHDFTFPLPANVKLSDLLVRYTEDPKYGGDISIEQGF